MNEIIHELKINFKISDKVLAAVNSSKEEFHGERNYIISSHPKKNRILFLLFY